MAIKDIIKYKDIDTYNKLIKMCKKYKKKAKLEGAEDIKRIMEERSAVLL